MTIEQIWDYLTETGIFTQEELELVTAINGYTIETLESAMYARTGYRNIEQLKEYEIF